MPSLSRFYDRYYFINALVIMSYGLLRCVKDAPELSLEEPGGYIGLSKVVYIVRLLLIAH
jgi:hypothetical protein